VADAPGTLAASGNLIGDSTTVLNTGPSPATRAKSLAAAGPISDYLGNLSLQVTRFGDALLIANMLVKATDAGSDGANKALLTGVQSALNGGGSPSTAVITSLNTVITNGPSAVTLANAIAPAGPILDYRGMTDILRTSLKTCYYFAGEIIKGTDAADPSLGLLQNIQACLV
jgi:hypothetical protein